MANSFKIQWGCSQEEYSHFLTEVKDGDTVTFIGMYGSDTGPESKANVTIIWMDAWDRPNKTNENGERKEDGQI